jgi:hypothetical protein
VFGGGFCPAFCPGFCAHAAPADIRSPKVQIILTREILSFLLFRDAVIFTLRKSGETAQAIREQKSI